MNRSLDQSRTITFLVDAASRIIFAFMLLFAAAGPAVGQTLSLVPAEVDAKFTPGKPTSFLLTVANGGDTPVALKASITDFWYNDKNEKLFERPGTSPRSAANWIEVVPRYCEVPARGSVSVRVMVTPPESGRGGYYAVVFLESKPVLVQSPSAETRNKSIFANVRLGSLILLRSDTATDYRVEVSGALLTPPTSTQKFKLDFMLANSGNTHVFPRTAVAILDGRHELVAKADGDIRRFLPGQKDRLSVEWAGVLPPGRYSAILTVIYGDGRVYTQELPFGIASDP